MGSVSFKASVEDAVQRCESRNSRLSVSGRYHKAPRTLDDDYDVDEKVLGTGTSGSVVLARNRDTGQSFALKTLNITGGTKEKKEEFKNEAEVFIGMDHPHIARLADVYESEDQLDLVMEHLTGGELFDRAIEKGYFQEEEAIDATWQMLLALNYTHSHGIAHRDIKLENYLYETKGSNHLKLIDFGLSKFWGPSTEMNVRCGTLSYCAPEVIKESYTSQCDLWSLGVVVFILLGGYMPFSGTAAQQVDLIKAGKYVMTEEAWDDVSDDAKDFVRKLLVVNPDHRLTAAQALTHPWFEGREQRAAISVIDQYTIDALRGYARASKFRRMCMSVMAWSLTNEELASVRVAFLNFDRSRRGTIKLSELSEILQANSNVQEEEIIQVVSAFEGSNCNGDEIQYSEFIAAMAASRIGLHEDLLQATFRRFDTDKSGYITAADLRQLLGESCACSDLDVFIEEADADKDGKISCAEFVSYLCVGSCNQARMQAAINLRGAKRERLASADHKWSATGSSPRSSAESQAKKRDTFFDEMSPGVNLGPTFFAKDDRLCFTDPV